MITEQRLNAIFESSLGASAFLWAPVIVFACSLFALRRQSVAVKVISSLVFSASTSFFCFFTALGWGLRDGLEPSIESHGAVAVSKFFEGFWSWLLFNACLFSLGFLPILVSKFKKWALED